MDGPAFGGAVVGVLDVVGGPLSGPKLFVVRSAVLVAHVDLVREQRVWVPCLLLCGLVSQQLL